MNRTKEAIGLINGILENGHDTLGKVAILVGCDDKADATVYSMSPLSMKSHYLRKPEFGSGVLCGFINSIPESDDAPLSVMAVVRHGDGTRHGAFIGAKALNETIQEMGLAIPQADAAEPLPVQFLDAADGRVACV